MTTFDTGFGSALSAVFVSLQENSTAEQISNPNIFFIIVICDWLKKMVKGQTKFQAASWGRIVQFELANRPDGKRLALA